MPEVLSPEWERVRLRHADPALAECLDLAEAPLDVDPPVVIPDDVLADVRQHALNVKPGFEVGGALIVRRVDHVAERYVRIENLATEPGLCHFAWREPTRWGFDAVHLHSHPHPSLRTPSSADLRHYRGGRFAIYHVYSGKIGVFCATADGRSFTEVATTLAAAAPPASVFEGERLVVAFASGARVVAVVPDARQELATFFSQNPAAHRRETRQHRLDPVTRPIAYMRQELAEPEHSDVRDAVEQNGGTVTLAAVQAWVSEEDRAEGGVEPDTEDVPLVASGAGARSTTRPSMTITTRRR